MRKCTRVLTHAEKKILYMANKTHIVLARPANNNFANYFSNVLPSTLTVLGVILMGTV